jgi:hypothetical protein
MHNTFVWSPGSARRKEVVSPLAFEADVCLSPATAIIVTNLLQIRQKAAVVSGQHSQTRLRSRVERVSLLYERVIVLVSEGNSEGSSTFPGEHDAFAYADFVGFTASLPASIFVYHVGGGDQILAQWIVSLMCRHDHETKETRNLIALVETRWETLLRHAGMNAYAAKVLLGVLRSTHGDRALNVLLSMTASERVRAFERYLGGRQVLQRASVALDMGWN